MSLSQTDVERLVKLRERISLAHREFLDAQRNDRANSGPLWHKLDRLYLELKMLDLEAEPRPAVFENINGQECWTCARGCRGQLAVVKKGAAGSEFLELPSGYDIDEQGRFLWIQGHRSNAAKFESLEHKRKQLIEAIEQQKSQFGSAPASCYSALEELNRKLTVPQYLLFNYVEGDFPAIIQCAGCRCWCKIPSIRSL